MEIKEPQLSDRITELRPYANRKMIYKEIEHSGGTAVFIIDPWTQRWVIATLPVMEVLKLADGKNTISQISKSLSNKGISETDVRIIVDELFEQGMLFGNNAEHTSTGLPVYNKSDITGFHLEVTNACNMVCEHCYVSSGKKMANELTLDEIKKTIDMLPPFSRKRIAISGGEPTVRKDIAEILKYCTLECGHDVDLYTNGRFFPENLAKQIIDINSQPDGGKVRIQMSLEGATEETNDKIRGPGAFRDALKTLEKLRRLGLNRQVVLFICITKHNVAEIDLMISLAEQYDVSMVVFSQWQRQGNAKDTPWQSIAPTKEEWVAAGEKILKYDNPRLMVFGNFFGDLNNNPYGRFSLESRIFPKHIYFYNAFPRITPEGDVFADQLWVDPTWILGNVRERDLGEFFETPKFYDQLSQFRVRTEKIDECSRCEWKELCQGGSPGHTYAEYGHMDKKDLFCESRIYWFNRFIEYQAKKTFGDNAKIKA